MVNGVMIVIHMFQILRKGWKKKAETTETVVLSMQVYEIKTFIGPLIITGHYIRSKAFIYFIGCSIKMLLKKQRALKTELPELEFLNIY